MVLFYIIIISVFLVYGLTKTQDKNSSKVYIIVMFSILGVMMMLKSTEVGNDTPTYMSLYKRLLTTTNMERFLNEIRYEKWFVYLCYALGKISQDAQLLFITTGAFVAFSFGRFIYKYSEIPWLSVLMFITLQFFDLSLSGTRQILAISILIFAYDFLIDKKFWKFLLTVLLASMFHNSVILFLLLYPLSKPKKDTRYYSIVVAIALVAFAGFDYILRAISVIFPGYIHYLTQESKGYSSTPTLATGLMLGLWLIIFFVSKHYGSKRKVVYTKEIQAISKKDYINSVHETAVWLGIVMLFLSLNGTILNRFKFIFAFPILVYYPNALHQIENKDTKMIFMIASSLVFVLYIWIIYTFRPEWQSSFPYTFFWQVD